jgi:hypothetical protein
VTATVMATAAVQVPNEQCRYYEREVTAGLITCCSYSEHSQSAHKNECYCYLSELAVDTYRGKENRYM